MNWGQGIAIFLAIFVISILAVVYKAYQTTTELVAEDYYNQEIAYQDEIDARKRGRYLERSLSLLVVKEEVIVQMDSLPLVEKPEGKIRFYRPSDSVLDREYAILMGGDPLKIPLSDFRTGPYTVELRWKEGSEACLAVLEDINMP